MYLLNGKRIRLDSELVVGEGDEAICYPAGSLHNAELRAALGVVEQPDPARPDDRAFFVTENADGTFTATARPRDQVTAQVWALIQIRRDQIKAGGVQVGAHWNHSDADSRLQHVNLARMADAVRQAGGSEDTALTGPDGAAIAWKTMDGSTVPMTCRLALDLVAADTALDLRAHAAAETHRAAMEQQENPFDYDFSMGWPETFLK